MYKAYSLWNEKRENLLIFSLVDERKRVSSCVILKLKLLRVLLGLIIMIAVDRSFEKSMLLFSFLSFCLLSLMLP